MLSLTAVSTVAVLTLLAPEGLYGTAASVALLIDDSRQDPYAAVSHNPNTDRSSSHYSIWPRCDKIVSIALLAICQTPRQLSTTNN
jgi:hypothetical protein